MLILSKANYNSLKFTKEIELKKRWYVDATGGTISISLHCENMDTKKINRHQRLHASIIISRFHVFVVLLTDTQQ